MSFISQTGEQYEGVDVDKQISLTVSKLQYNPYSETAQSVIDWSSNKLPPKLFSTLASLRQSVIIY
jgi:hypothetical protein